MRTLASKWNIQNPLDVMCEAPNRFICRFESEEDRNRIEAMQPWQLHGHILLMIHYKPGMDAATQEIQTVPIWMNLNGLHLEHHSVDATTIIASAAGKVKKIELPKSGLGFRARVEVNIENPLVQGTPVNICEGDDVWVSFFYNPVPPCFCAKCLRLGHEQFNCTYPTEERDMTLLQLEYHKTVEKDKTEEVESGQEDNGAKKEPISTKAQADGPKNKGKQKMTEAKPKMGKTSSKVAKPFSEGLHTDTNSTNIYDPNELGIELTSDYLIATPIQIGHSSPSLSLTQAADNLSMLNHLTTTNTLTQPPEKPTSRRRVGRPIGAVDSKPRQSKGSKHKSVKTRSVHEFETVSPTKKRKLTEIIGSPSSSNTQDLSLESCYKPIPPPIDTSKLGYPAAAPYIWELLQLPEIANFFLQQGVLNPALAPAMNLNNSIDSPTSALRLPFINEI
ncbi:hypothetical protein FRX31_009223, partial [Thalictrum thalictroides]